MLVPDDGAGEVRQLVVYPGRLRRAAQGAGVALVGLALVLAGGATLLPRALGHEALVAENASLRSRIVALDARFAALEPLVARVRAYDEQLRALESRQALPGFGPLDPEEMAARQAWIDGVVPAIPGQDRDPGVEARLAGLEDDLAALSPGLDSFEEVLARYAGLEGALPKLWPVDGVLTSPYGYRTHPFSGRWRLHTGLDLGAPWGTPILAANDGLVVYTGWDAGHGLAVVLDHGQEVTTRYFHASRVLVEEGDLVETGDAIALVGSSGMSTGPHLHFELDIGGEKVDPLEYLP